MMWLIWPQIWVVLGWESSLLGSMQLKIVQQFQQELFIKVYSILAKMM